MGLVLSVTAALLLALESDLFAQPIVSREMLTAHNRVRARVGVPPLKWSQKLAVVAQQWANELLASGKFAHRPKSQYGENVFEIRGGHANPAQVVADWVAEARDYDAARNTCRTGKMCGNYTQVIWRISKKVGCGVAQEGKREIWVCNYDPRGNWVGERPH
jgi:pathogenesis-related protein 1